MACLQCCEGGIRTPDLMVMSHPSYPCSTSQSISLGHKSPRLVGLLLQWGMSLTLDVESFLVLNQAHVALDSLLELSTRARYELQVKNISGPLLKQSLKFIQTSPNFPQTFLKNLPKYSTEMGQYRHIEGCQPIRCFSDPQSCR